MSDDPVKALIRSTFDEATKKAAGSISPCDLMKEIQTQGAERRRQAINALLGFDNKWGECQLYQTNGHRTEIQRWIMDAIGADLRTWVEESAAKALEDMKADAKQEIYNAIAKQVKDGMRDQIRRQTLDAMQAFARDMSQAAIRDYAKEIFDEGLPQD